MAPMSTFSQRLRYYNLSLGVIPNKTYPCSPPPTNQVPSSRIPLPFTTRNRSFRSSAVHQWRSSVVLDSYVEKPARPISLRQLIFFGGRNLDERRIIDYANYVRSELPVRIAHRIRDMQKLPYVVVTNRHLSEVYELYYSAFDAFRKIPEIKTIEDNDSFCQVVKKTLKEHLTVIPSLAMGVLECRDLVSSEELDKFMNQILRSRISRRVIAEQHLALTDTFNSPFHFPDLPSPPPPSPPLPHHRHHHSATDWVGEVFPRCNAREVVETVGKHTQDLAREANGPNSRVPEIQIEGHSDTTFPYILSHIEYIIGELLRNSIQATVDRHSSAAELPPIRILICHAPQHVIFRVSDRGGGVPADELADLWSFAKGPRPQTRLQNFSQVPKMAATLQELQKTTHTHSHGEGQDSSLSTLTSRPPQLRLGMGLPMSRVYAEYWAGSLELQSLEGYGTDVFLQISKLGNKSEQLNLDCV